MSLRDPFLCHVLIIYSSLTVNNTVRHRDKLVRREFSQTGLTEVTHDTNL